MHKPTRRFSAALAAAAIAGATLLVPTAAHAADLNCDSGRIAGPLQSATVKDASGATLGQMQAPLCAVTGQLIPHPQFTTAPGSYEVEFRPGTTGLVEQYDVTIYPAVSTEQLEKSGRFFAIAAEDDLPGGVWDKLGSASDGLFAMPGTGGPFSAGPVSDGLASSTAFLSSDDPELTAQGAAGLAGEVTWQPVVDPASGDVLWSVQEYLVPLASEGDSKRTFEVPSAGYQVYAAPTDASAQRELATGDTVQATTFTAGWALSDDGWIREPAVKQVEKKEGSGETWAKVKEKSKSAWDATKDKAGDLTATAKEKVESKKASSKALTFGSMITASVLTGLALVTALIAFAARRTRSLAAAVTPAGIAQNVAAYAAAPASLALSIAAVSTAPWVWVWPPLVSSAISLVSAAAVYITAARVRGGNAHESTEALQAGLRSPVAIGAGAAVAAVAIGGSVIAGLAWPAYVVSVLGAAAIYAGFALTAKRAPESAEPTAATDTTPGASDQPAANMPNGETVEESVEAEAEMAE